MDRSVGHPRGGQIAREWVVPGIHISDRGVVAAVASRHAGQSRGAGRPPWRADLASYEALLADPEIDAVYVPLPNHAHVEWTRKCLEDGKHVLTEKPIALKAEEIDALIAPATTAASSRRRPSWSPSSAVAADPRLVQGGAIGRLGQVQCGFSFLLRDPGNIRNTDQGGGALRDIGVYPSVTTRFVTGAEPVAVTHAEIDWDLGMRPPASWPPSPISTSTSTSRCAWRPGIDGFPWRGGTSCLGGIQRRRLCRPGDRDPRRDGRVTIERFGRADQYRAQITHSTPASSTARPTAARWILGGNQPFIDMIYAAAGPGRPELRSPRRLPGARRAPPCCGRAPRRVVRPGDQGFAVAGERALDRLEPGAEREAGAAARGDHLAGPEHLGGIVADALAPGLVAEEAAWARSLQRRAEPLCRPRPARRRAGKARGRTLRTAWRGSRKSAVNGLRIHEFRAPLHKNAACVPGSCADEIAASAGLISRAAARHMRRHAHALPRSIDEAQALLAGASYVAEPRRLRQWSSSR